MLYTHRHKNTHLPWPVVIYILKFQVNKDWKKSLEAEKYKNVNRNLQWQSLKWIVSVFYKLSGNKIIWIVSLFIENLQKKC